MANWLTWLGCTALAAIVVYTPVFGQQQPVQSPGDRTLAPTFKSGVDLVTVGVVVQDKNGRPVTNLSRSDFEIVDSGERREIANFRAEPTPVTVALLFDVSGSMDVSQKMPAARNAVRHLLSWLDSGPDQAALFTFDTRLQEVQPFTTSFNDVLRRLDTVRPFGATSMYDAIAQTGQRLADRGGMRRAVVVITDGLDNHSRLSPGEVSDIASAIDVPVYILAVASRLDHPGTDMAVGHAPDFPLDGPLEKLARWTGGAFFIVSAPAHASVASRQIIRELRQQYLIAFEPGERAGWHSLDIRTRDVRFTVRARSGYIAGARANTPS